MLFVYFKYTILWTVVGSIIRIRPFAWFEFETSALNGGKEAFALGQNSEIHNGKNRKTDKISNSKNKKLTCPLRAVFH